jgi:hypothetical protein
MSVAVIRPDAWELPLLVHVAGAMILVGSLATVLTCLLLARRDSGAALPQVGFRTLLLGAFPGFVLMRAGAEWISSEEDAPEEAAWIGIGYIVSDAGFLLLIAATVLAGLAVRRLRRRGAPAGRLATATSVLMAVNLAGYAVAIWAMTTKPE